MLDAKLYHQENPDETNWTYPIDEYPSEDSDSEEGRNALAENESEDTKPRESFTRGFMRNPFWHIFAASSSALRRTIVDMQFPCQELLFEE